MIQSISTISSSIINRFLFSSNISRKISVPVHPFQSSSLAFKHILGVPTKKNGEAVPIYKLRMLDNLIEHFIQLRSSKALTKVYKNINPENIDILIENLELSLKKELSTHPPLFSGLFPQTGMILNILV